MAKYTIIYRRTIQTQKYHTSTIGLSQEYDTAEKPWDVAFYEVRNWVNDWIEHERKDLKVKG